MQLTFPAALALLFIGLKLANVITWSWLWVLCPLWIGLAIFVTFMLVLGLIALFALIISCFVYKN